MQGAWESLHTPWGGGRGFMDDLIAFLVREEQRLYVRSARGIDVGMKEQP